MAWATWGTPGEGLPLQLYIYVSVLTGIWVQVGEDRDFL